MGTITTTDGTEIFYKDWGSGQPLVFSHGWPLSADDWDTQMLFFLQHGYRVIAHDRRGHGRSAAPAGRRERAPGSTPGATALDEIREFPPPHFADSSVSSEAQVHGSSPVGVATTALVEKERSRAGRLLLVQGGRAGLDRRRARSAS